MVKDNNKKKVLEIKNLVVTFELPNKKKIKPVNNVSLDVYSGETVGIVGESGCGKSSFVSCITQLLPQTAKIVSGSIKFNGEELIGLKPKKLQKIRGKKIAVIPQNPMSSFDSIYKIESQMKEIFKTHLKEKFNEQLKEKKNYFKKALEDYKNNKTEENNKKLKNADKELKEFEKMIKNYIHDRSVELLKSVGINDPEKRLKQYPKQMSGGMLQRVAIAMSLICEPDILIADEPTTALDVTVQYQILNLLKIIQEKEKMSIILITHDLGVIANLCDKVNVMYAGSIIETGYTNEIFLNPKHEYTKKLLSSTPKENSEVLETIKGNPIVLSKLPIGCAFSERCDNCMKICLEKKPILFKVNDNHYSACFKYLYDKYKKKEITINELKKILEFN